ncbi:MAG: hypothetical protein HC800_17815 [Phormidesmis sp. RL_2_1]|nr:hypothetical protein [Phormidesmis sp. RL_2_1]
MSTTVLPQLQAIEAELVSQKEQLEAQLASVHEKLTGIRTVLPMFAQTTDAAAAEPVAAEPLPPSPAVEEPAVEEPVVAEAPAPTKETTRKKTVQKKAATPKKAAAQNKTPEKKAPAKAASAKKVDGRAASWQKYTRPGVKNESIPDAVKLILATQPKNEFKIADVMTALFEEEMPKSQYLKARNRISNVLSGGVRAGDWYKGERGTYRMTAA